MGYLCGSAVVKFKTYQMTSGREIMNIATREQTKHKWRKNMPSLAVSEAPITNFLIIPVSVSIPKWILPKTYQIRLALIDIGTGIRPSHH